MSIALITPTRSRAEQLSLVIDCVNNQTLLPDEWVIVDDGNSPVNESILKKIKIPYKYIHYNSGLSTSTSLNSAKALELAHADKYIFFDDDDYYPPRYVEEFDKLLIVGHNEMIGNMRWIDYRLSTGYYRIRLKTEKHIEIGDTLSEWHGSGIVGEELKQEMIKVLKEHPKERYNDCLCFRHIFSKGKYPCITIDFGDWGAISLKDYGVGNRGLIQSHFSNDGMLRDDNYEFFKTHLGNDWKRYEKYLGRLR